MSNSRAGLTYSEAAGKVARSRGGEPKVGHNTILRAAGPNHSHGVDYIIRYQWTDVVTLHADGTYTLNTGGWHTPTTMRRFTDYSPASVYSEKGTLCVWHRDDPVTAPKFQKCRICHGTGQTHTVAYTETNGWLPYPSYEVTEDYHYNSVGPDGVVYGHVYVTNADTRLDRDGRALYDQPRQIKIVGQVKRHEAGTWGRLPKPIFHPSEAHKCGRCDGDGRADYGSKRNPVRFYDGIVVDSDGKVTDPNARRLYESAEAKAARLAAEAVAEAKAAKARARAARADKARWLAAYGLTATRGKVTLFKAVDDELRSGFRNTIRLPDGMSYPIGETVIARDWQDYASCGNGLHFGPTPMMAQTYYPSASRFLACQVSVRDMVVIGDKVKAPSCRVLYEVDRAGQPAG